MSLDAFAGKWEIESSEKFDDYLKAIGVGLIKRQLANSVKPIVTITVNGNHGHFLSESSAGKTVVEFDLDVEFEETTADGRKCKTTFRFVDGKLVQDQKCAGGVDSIMTRYIEDGKMVVVMEAKDAKGVRKYKRA